MRGPFVKSGPPSEYRPPRMATVGSITDEGIARLRARIGIPEPHPCPPHYLRPDTDTFRHVAECYGDDNPLFCNPEYAAGTRWNGPVAPPAMVGGDTLIGEDEVEAVAPEHRELMKGDPLRGVHAFYAASAREWWAPLRPGTRTWRRNALVGVLDKASDFAERAVHEWTAQVFRTDEGQLLSGQYRNMVRTERTKARERKRDDVFEAASYSEEDIADIDAQYASEAPRGATARSWEDVNEGDEVGPLVKGPLTVTDMICWHTGMGMGLYGVQPLRLGWKNRQRIPRFYHRDELGVPDVMQRVHWDPAYRATCRQPDDVRLRPHARDMAHPPLHGLDGRRRMAVAARLRVPQVQLGRRHALDARPDRAEVPGGGRPPRGRPRDLGGEPTR